MARTATCARCGRSVEPGQYLCDQCREEAPVPVVGKQAPKARPPSDLEERARRWPAGMPRPSPAQYHATVMVTIFLVLAALAALAFLGHHGVGPFTGTVDGFHLQPGNRVAVTITVHNQGSKTARATCNVSALGSNSVSLGETTVLTDPIPGHGSGIAHASIPGVGEQPASVKADCS